MQLPEKAFVYIGDPMCSWCYGFSPVLQEFMHEKATSGIPFFPVVGGLRPGERSEELDDRLARLLEHHWHQVEKFTGRHFDYSLLIRRGFRYDTEPSCRAVVAVRAIDRAKAFPFFFALQSAFYAEGKDPTDEETFTEVASQHGIESSAFIAAFQSEPVLRETQTDFSFCQSLGITGFPTLLYIEGKTAYPLTQGYRSIEDLRASFDHTLEVAKSSA